MAGYFQQYWRAGLEILILSFAVYFILRFIKGTRGARIMTGLILLLLVLTVLSQAFDLETINWLLGHFFTFIVVALIVIFQPELRRALAEVGNRPIFFTGGSERELVEGLVRVALNFSSRKVGALIAVEREINLQTLAEGGAVIDARFSPELLEQIFYPNSPLHDGGVIIRIGRIQAAACIFPLTQRTDLAKSVGTRHRAALGLAEETDAVLLVVSEETGQISIACAGKLNLHLDRDALQRLLTDLVVNAPEPSWVDKVRALFNPPRKALEKS